MVDFHKVKRRSSGREEKMKSCRWTRGAVLLLCKNQEPTGSVPSPVTARANSCHYVASSLGNWQWAQSSGLIRTCTRYKKKEKICGKDKYACWNGMDLAMSLGSEGWGQVLAQTRADCRTPSKSLPFQKWRNRKRSPLRSYPVCSNWESIKALPNF